MSNGARRMPSVRAIREHWDQWLLDVGKQCALGEVIADANDGQQWCFACGFTGRLPALDRAHLVARCNGGTDDVSNIVLLCRECHRAFDAVDRTRDDGLDWIARRSVLDLVIHLVVDIAALTPVGFSSVERRNRA